MKYFTIKHNANIHELMMRIKFEVSNILSYNILSISDLMGKGIGVITLTNMNYQVKVEVYDDQVDELKNIFKKPAAHNKPIFTKRRQDGLDNINDLWK